MNRQDILELQRHRTDPSLSILFPTHRTSPDNKRDPILLKNLVTEATDRLVERLGKRDAAPMIRELERQVAAIDLRQTLDGMAIFVSAEHAGVYLLPVPLSPRVVIDDSFATRDLVFALNRSARYWVLTLSTQPTRLFEGVRETLVEVRGGGFPMVHENPEASEPLPEMTERSKLEEAWHRQFFRRVDQALSAYTKADPVPVCVVGVERWLAYFQNVSDHKDVVATLTGNHDQTPPRELGKLVWPVVADALAVRRQRALDALDAAVGAQRFASGLGEAWRRAQEGRGDLLLVERDYHQAARFDEASNQLHLLAADDPGANMADAVDDLIELVLAKQGDVVFVDDGVLEGHGQVALTLRY
jgi:hypothetical protein